MDAYGASRGRQDRQEYPAVRQICLKERMELYDLRTNIIDKSLTRDGIELVLVHGQTSDPVPVHLLLETGKVRLA